MRIAVINGSPKGKNSITLQTTLYLSKKYTEHEFEVLNAAQIIKLLERDFSRAEKILTSADAVIFSYPVYTFLAPYGLHRFIELLKASGIDLSGKYATQISTSKHFFDVTAARYVEDNIADFGMKYVNGLLADMDDLLKKEGRAEAERFFEYFLWSIEKGHCDARPAITSLTPYSPVMATLPSPAAEGGERDIVIITDETDPNSSLSAMIMIIGSRNSA